jgi:hypothetical protein
MTDTADKPFVATWWRTTGDRLTRAYDHVETFATAQEAIDAIARPFAVPTKRALVWTRDGELTKKIATRVPNKRVVVAR